jgi:hypothetical protein
MRAVMSAPGPRKAGEGTEPEQQGIISFCMLPQGCAPRCQALWQWPNAVHMHPKCDRCLHITSLPYDHCLLQCLCANAQCQLTACSMCCRGALLSITLLASGFVIGAPPCPLLESSFLILQETLHAPYHHMYADSNSFRSQLSDLCARLDLHSPRRLRFTWCSAAVTSATGPSGCSVRELARVTGADIKSWSDSFAAAPGCAPRPARTFLLQVSRQSPFMPCSAIGIGVHDCTMRHVVTARAMMWMTVAKSGDGASLLSGMHNGNFCSIGTGTIV